MATSLRRGSQPRGRRGPAPVFLFALLLLLFASSAFADDARVLPKGRSFASLENLFYFSTQSRWNPHGNEEKVAGVFNERLLTAADFGLGSSALTLGTSFLRYDYRFNILDFSAAYGLTDRLTFGVDIPYYQAQNKVRALVSSQGANLCISLVTGGIVPCGSPGGTRPITTEDIQQVLTRGIPGVPGFGFKRVQTFSADGLGDITAVGKYQYFKNEDWRLAVSGGVRFPTGRQDDPDNLADVAWSSGAYALLLRLHHDYIVSNLWKGRATEPSLTPRAGDVTLDFTFRYDWVLPDQATVRISSASNPITRNRERLDRNLGDRFEIEFAGTYQVLRSLSVSALYKYGWKVEDHIYGNETFPTGALEKDTDSTEQIFIVRGTYSTLPLYLAGKVPFPMNISVGYRDRFAGSGPRNAASPSQYLKTRYISLVVQVPF